MFPLVVMRIAVDGKTGLHLPAYDRELNDPWQFMGTVSIRRGGRDCPL
jgi:hypothetical protein